MKRRIPVSYTLLYVLWAVLFALTAGLGFIPEPEGMTRTVLMLLAGAFFLPPCAILIKANREGRDKHRLVIRNLSVASVGSTLVLMALNVMSANWSEAVGNALHAALTVVSAPMMCGQTYILGLFLWGCLLMGSMSKTNAER